MSNPRKVAVIGAGYAGVGFCLAALARGLDRRFEFTLFERAAQPGPVGAGILLQPSGQFVLKKLGLFSPEFQKTLHPYRRLRARDRVTDTFLDLPVAEAGFQTYGAHRGSVFQAMLTPLQVQAENDAVRLEFGTEIDRAQREPDGWRLWSAGADLGRFDLVVLADGGRSTNRSRFGLSCFSKVYEIGALWCVGQSSFPQGELLQSCQGTSRIVGLLPTDNSDGVSFFYSCSSQEYSLILKRPYEQYVEQVLRVAPEAEPLLAQAGGFEGMLHTRYLHGWMPRWHAPGVVVLGDAAHPMSPHLGQGVNLALMDAYALAKSLEQCEPADALRRYQKRRQGQVALNSWLSLVLTPFFQSQPDLGQGHLRNLGVKFFSAWPWMRAQMQGAVWGRKADLWGLVEDFEEIC